MNNPKNEKIANKKDIKKEKSTKPISNPKVKTEPETKVEAKPGNSILNKGKSYKIQAVPTSGSTLTMVSNSHLTVTANTTPTKSNTTPTSSANTSNTPRSNTTSTAKSNSTTTLASTAAPNKSRTSTSKVSCASADAISRKDSGYELQTKPSAVCIPTSKFFEIKEPSNPASSNETPIQPPAAKAKTDHDEEQTLVLFSRKSSSTSLDQENETN